MVRPLPSDAMNATTVEKSSPGIRNNVTTGIVVFSLWSNVLACYVLTLVTVIMATVVCR